MKHNLSDKWVTIDPETTATRDLHQFILSSVSPRPIAFASTIDDNGVQNLAPYSFFNAFSSNPPILVFSSNRRVENNTTKDTLHNIMQNKEVVINVVNYDMVQAMSMTSIEFAANVSEFEACGFTPIASDLVKPMRVAESPVNIECKVTEIIPLGEEGGAGHLILCNVVKMHINEAVLKGGDKVRIDPFKLDSVSRLGGLYYCRVNAPNIFEINQDIKTLPIGYNALPEGIRNSNVLTANDIAKMAGLPELPSSEEVASVNLSRFKTRDEAHAEAKDLILQTNLRGASALLWAAEKV